MVLEHDVLGVALGAIWPPQLLALLDQPAAMLVLLAQERQFKGTQEAKALEHPGQGLHSWALRAYTNYRLLEMTFTGPLGSPATGHHLGAESVPGRSDQAAQSARVKDSPSNRRDESWAKFQPSRAAINANLAS